MTDAETGATTDVDHWDELLRGTPAPTRYPAWHATFGRRGAFLSGLERRIGPVDGMRVVELGGACSVRLLALARHRGCDVVAVDFSAARLAATERLFAINGARVTCVHADMFALPALGDFDLVTHWGLAEHFDAPASVLEVSARLARRGQPVVFGMPNMRALGAALWRRECPANWSTHIYHSDEAIAAACRAAGLRLAQVFHWGAPMIQIAAWEHPRPWLRAVSLAQLGVGGLGKFLPIYQWGTRRLSAERGFVAIAP